MRAFLPRVLMANRVLLLLVGFLILMMACSGTAAQDFVCVRFKGTYNLYLSHVHVEEIISINAHQNSTCLLSESLSPLEGLENVSFDPSNRIDWDYDGSTLNWTFEPAVSAGQNLTYIREWDINLEPDDIGIRYLPIYLRQSQNASLSFHEHDVNVIDASLPLDCKLRYQGNVSAESHFVTFSSRYKLYEYRWGATFRNEGEAKSLLRVNMSIPGDLPFQEVLESSPNVNTVGDLGNLKCMYDINLRPSQEESITGSMKLLTTTWRGMETGLSGFDAADGDLTCAYSDYWPRDDPRIRDFARRSAGNKTGLEVLFALSRSVAEHLEYAQLKERKGALWALENRVGSCMEHSDLFVACARSLGIPSLYVSGVCGRNPDGGRGHSWVIAWTPESEWVGIDPTFGQEVELDSGRLVIRLCNPEDIGVSYRYNSGNISMMDWYEEWNYREVSEMEAMSLSDLGAICSVPFPVFSSAPIIVLIIIYTGKRPLS